MGELQPIREIAKQLIENYRKKRLISPVVYFSETPADVQGAVDVLAEPWFDGLDREWLRDLGIEA